MEDVYRTIASVADGIYKEKGSRFIAFAYPVMNDVMKIIKEMNPEVIERNFELECDMLLEIRQKDHPTLHFRLKQVESLVFIEE